jgi:mono/diheme cytochrome c family protein
MLHGVDKSLELAGWFLAALVVILLFVGPQVVAEDKPAEPGGANAGAPATDGQAVFTDRCGACHTLSAAGTSGVSGPSLDGVGLDAAAIEAIVSEGRGGMPAFGGELSEAEISAVADFVAGAQ